MRLENNLKFNSFIVPSLLELNYQDLRSHGQLDIHKKQQFMPTLHVYRQ